MDVLRRDDQVVFECRKCGHWIVADVSPRGTRVRCDECGSGNRKPGIAMQPRATAGQIAKIRSSARKLRVSILLSVLLVALTIVAALVIGGRPPAIIALWVAGLGAFVIGIFAIEANRHLGGSPATIVLSALVFPLFVPVVLWVLIAITFRARKLAARGPAPSLPDRQKDAAIDAGNAPSKSSHDRSHTRVGRLPETILWAVALVLALALAIRIFAPDWISAAGADVDLATLERITFHPRSSDDDPEEKKLPRESSIVVDSGELLDLFRRAERVNGPVVWKVPLEGYADFGDGSRRGVVVGRHSAKFSVSGDPAHYTIAPDDTQRFLTLWESEVVSRLRTLTDTQPSAAPGGE